MGESIGFSLSKYLPKEKSTVNFNPYDNVIFQGTPEDALQHPHPWLRGPVSIIPSEYSDPRTRPSQFQTLPIQEPLPFSQFVPSNPVPQVSTVNPFVTDNLFNPYQNIPVAPYSPPRIMRTYSPRFSTIGHYSPRVSIPQRTLSPHIHSYASKILEFPSVDPFTTNAATAIPSYQHLVEPTFTTNFPSIIPGAGSEPVVDTQSNIPIVQAQQMIPLSQPQNLATVPPAVNSVPFVRETNSSPPTLPNPSSIEPKALGISSVQSILPSQFQNIQNVPTYSVPVLPYQNISYAAQYPQQVATNSMAENRFSFYSYPNALSYSQPFIQNQNSRIQATNIANFNPLSNLAQPFNTANSHVYPIAINPQEGQQQVYRSESFGAPSQIFTVNSQPLPLPNFGQQNLSNETNIKNQLNSSLISNSVNLGKVEFQGSNSVEKQFLSNSIDDSLPLEEPVYAKKSYFGSEKR